MSDCSGAIYRKFSADTGLAEGGVLSRSAKYEVYGRIAADTLAKILKAERLAFMWLEDKPLTNSHIRKVALPKAEGATLY